MVSQSFFHGVPAYQNPIVSILQALRCSMRFKAVPAADNLLSVGDRAIQQPQGCACCFYVQACRRFPLVAYSALVVIEYGLFQNEIFGWSTQVVRHKVTPQPWQWQVVRAWQRGHLRLSRVPVIWLIAVWMKAYQNERSGCQSPEIDLVRLYGTFHWQNVRSPLRSVKSEHSRRACDRAFPDSIHDRE
jgi:hypothetical protein